MIYEIIFSNSADKQISKLSIEIQERIIATLKRCRIRPYQHIKKLTTSKYFRLRIGDYRAIVDIIDNKLIIYVVEIKHRKKVYK